MSFSNRCVRFEGGGEYVTMGDVLGFERADTFSISVWLKTTQATSGTILAKTVASGFPKGFEFLTAADGTVHLWLSHDKSTGDYIDVGTDDVVNTGVWTHVVVTYDGTSAAAGVLFYINGVPAATTVGSDALTDSIWDIGPFLLGKDVLAARVLVGRMDELAVYSAVLSAAEVSWIFNSGRPVDMLDVAAPAHLLSWWRMGEGDTYPTLQDSGPGAVVAFPTIADVSGNGRHGTVVDMTAACFVGTVPPGGYTSTSILFASPGTVQMGDVLGYGRTIPFSISFWVKKTGANVGGFVAKAIGAGGNGWRIYTTSGSEVSFFGYHVVGNSYLHMVSAAGILTGDWQHICLTYDGSETVAGLHLYVDGIEAAYAVQTDHLAPACPWDNAGPFILGYGWGGSQWAGYMDEVAAYGKELSIAEVGWVYNGGVPCDLLDASAPSSLDGWWRMGDIIIAKNPGTMTGMTSADIFSDSPDLGAESSVVAITMLADSPDSNGPEGVSWVGNGGSPPVVTYYKMRARDSGAAAPGYVTWVASTKDFAGAGYAGALPTPVGAMVAGSVIVVGEI